MATKNGDMLSNNYDRSNNRLKEELVISKLGCNFMVHVEYVYFSGSFDNLKFNKIVQRPRSYESSTSIIETYIRIGHRYLKKGGVNIE